MNNPVPAIVLGGHIMGLTAIRALAKRNVPIILLYHSSEDYAASSKYLTRSIKIPHPEKEEKEFLQILFELGSELKDAVIIPCDDEFLTTIAKNKEALEKYFKVACNNYDVISKLIDKKYIYSITQSGNIPTPRSITTDNNEEAVSFANEIGFPLLVKPSKSHLYVKVFGKKMAKVFDRNDLQSELKNAASAGLDVLIQEYIPGKDNTNYSYWGYRVDGSFYCEATAQKIRNDPPETGSPRLQVTKNVPELIPLARKILNAINYEGYANIEFKKDHRTNEFKFLEINPRINRCMLQAIKGGIDYPWIIYDHLTSGNLPGETKCKEGIYWIDFAKDIVRSLQYRKIEKYSLSEYIKPYLKPHVFAVLSLSDPKPFLKRSSGFIKEFLKKKS